VSCALAGRVYCWSLGRDACATSETCSAKHGDLELIEFQKGSDSVLITLLRAIGCLQALATYRRSLEVDIWLRLGATEAGGSIDGDLARLLPKYYVPIMRAPLQILALL